MHSDKVFTKAYRLFLAMHSDKVLSYGYTDYFLKRTQIIFTHYINSPLDLVQYDYVYEKNHMVLWCTFVIHSDGISSIVDKEEWSILRERWVWMVY